MPTYEVEINGQTFEIEAPDDASVKLAVRQLQAQSGQPAQAEEGGFDFFNKVGLPGPLEAAQRGSADTLMFGLSDEIAAVPRWIGTQLGLNEDNGFQGSLDAVRSEQKALADQNPVATGTGQVIGGLALASRLPSMNFGSGLGMRSLAGAAEGGLYGGLYGAGSGEGLGGRVADALTGAGTGAVIGGAVPVVAQGVSSAYRNVADRMAASKASRDAGVSPEVARLLTDVMGADDSLGATGRANMGRAGSEAMLADAGPNARQVLDTAIQRGGAGAVNARRAIEDRVSRGASDLTGVLDNTLGAPEGVFTAREAVRRGTSSARGNAYDAAYSQPIDYSAPKAMEIENLVRSRVPGSAIRRANELMRAEGAQSEQILARIADDGSVTYERMPDVRQMDYITRALNDLADAGEGAGAMGGQNALGRAYQNLSRDIRSNLRDVVPAYGDALDTAADAIGRSKAIETGSKALSAGTRVDEFADAMRGMSAAEKRGVAQGIRSQIDHEVGNVTRAIQDGNMDAREAVSALKKLSSRNNRDKVALAIGDAEADRLFAELDRVATSFDLRASVAENSKTYARQATERRVQDATAPGPIRTAAQGEPVNAGRRIVQALTGQTPERQLARQNAIYSEAADFLTAPAQRSIPAFQALSNFGGQTIQNRIRADAIAQALLGGGRPLAYPLSSQSVQSMRPEGRR